MAQVFFGCPPRSQLDDRLTQRDDDDQTVALDEIRRYDPKSADSRYQGLPKSTAAATTHSNSR